MDVGRREGESSWASSAARLSSELEVLGLEPNRLEYDQSINQSALFRTGHIITLYYFICTACKVPYVFIHSIQSIVTIVT